VRFVLVNADYGSILVYSAYGMEMPNKPDQRACLMIVLNCSALFWMFSMDTSAVNVWLMRFYGVKRILHLLFPMVLDHDAGVIPSSVVDTIMPGSLQCFAFGCRGFWRLSYGYRLAVFLIV